MRYISVCSGIEAASAAWHQLGWEPVAFAEIEPFPSAVLAHHFPEVPNLGDMTTIPERIISGEVAAPDILVGGTPCQAFSVAGLRNSLDDNRGQLSLTFIRIADAIDHVRRARGEPPCIILWENVPGVLSTKDNAFGCFLGALAGEDGEIDPSGKRWTNAGAVLGPQRTVAWRILDAQYFGVAQRRRRVFVVASARDGFDPAAVLFEFDGVRRDSAPSREARQSVATSPAAGAGSGSAHAFKVRGGCEGGGKGYLGSDEVAFTPSTLQDQTIAARMVAFGEYVEDGTASAMKARDYKDATDLVAQTYSTPAIGHIVQDDVASTITKNTGAGGETQNPAYVAQPIHYRKSRRAQSVDDHETWVEDDATNTLNCFDVGDVRAVDVVAQPIGVDCYNGALTGDVAATMGTMGSPINSAGPQVMQTVVAQPIPLDLRNAGRDANKHDEMNRQGLGVGQPGDPAHTLSTACVHGVAQPIAWTEELTASVDVAGTIQRGGAGGRHDGVAVPVTQWGEVAGSLTARHDSSPCADRGQNIVAQPVAIGLDEEQNARIDGFGTLKARMEGGGFEGSVMTPAMQVRRLTPTECERLQGFPDGWTDIPWRGKPNAPDGPRYKALGNSMAVPCMAWIGKRIAAVAEAL